MTSSHRPETSSETTVPEATTDTGPKAGNAFFADSSVQSQPETAETPESPDPYARPMSERQRRRLAEQQRLAEQRTQEASRQNQFLSPMDEASDGALTKARDHSPAVSSTKVSKTARKKTSGGSSIYLLAILASGLWVGGIGAWFSYEFGAGLVDLEPIRIAVYALIAIAPVGLFFMLAHALRMGSLLAQENRRARELADAMIAPTVYGAEQTSSIVSALREDIEEAANVAERARQELTKLRESLLNEATRLTDAARTAQVATQNITRTMGDERQQLATLGDTLDNRAIAVADAVQRQAQMVADASDLAQAQLREAEASLAARAADLAAAATEAQDAARMAAEDLSRQTLRLETAGSGVTEQIKAVEDGLSQQRAALVTAAYSLRTDQEDFAAQIETQRAQFIDQLSQSRTAATELNLTGDQIAEGIKTQTEAVIEQFRTLVGMSQREADGFDAATKLSLDKFEMLAAESRERLLEETRSAVETLNRAAAEQRQLAEQALQQAQIRADRLGESLFDAARQADDAAESRIAGARRIVDETVKMVDQTGMEAMHRLESLTRRMTEALGQIEASVRDLDDRAARLPEETAQRMAAVRQNAEQSLASLSDASRRAACEAEALDAGFQDRVRKNFEMVNEAVRLIGTPKVDAASINPETDGSIVHNDPMRIPLRPASLNPTPAPQPEPPPLHQEQRQPDPAQNTAALNWQATHTPEPQVPLHILSEIAVTAVRRMGVDPNALLPRARIEDVAYALSRQDLTRARQVVRRVAPAAVRSINRRIKGDDKLVSDINQFINAFASTLDEAGDDQHAINTRLATDEGRAFMIFDAALDVTG